jgi:hypothetical protein
MSHSLILRTKLQPLLRIRTIPLSLHMNTNWFYWFVFLIFCCNLFCPVYTRGLPSNNAVWHSFCETSSWFQPSVFCYTALFQGSNLYECQLHNDIVTVQKIWNWPWNNAVRQKIEGKSREEVSPEKCHTALFEGRPQLLITCFYLHVFIYEHTKPAKETLLLFHKCIYLLLLLYGYKLWKFLK